MPVVLLPFPTAAQNLGLDLGLKDAVVPSDAPPIPAPRFYRRGARKLRRAQRTYSRRQKAAATRRRHAPGWPACTSVWPTNGPTSCTS